MTKHSVIGLDLAKNSNALVAYDGTGKPLWRKTKSRTQLRQFLAQQPVSTVVMEACSGAHFLAQQIEQMGHTAVLYPPKHVKSYQRGQKNDYNDARALVEAHQHGHLRPVPVKSVEQQDAALVVLQRKQLKEEQIRLGNQMRALLAERGLALPVGVGALKAGVPRVLEDASNSLTNVVRHILAQAYTRYLGLLEELAWYDRQLARQAREDDVCRRLCGVPGIGPIVAGVLQAWMGDGRQFRRGRDASAALGLVPRQFSTGGREVLLGITKRGNRYVRSQVVNGAQAVLRYAAGKDDALSRWVMRLKQARGHNKAVVALANKLVRIAWVVIARGETYQPRMAA
ncbi:IS110 family transposase [Parahaliea maris]|uniref:IS110 family transposase n=1 Tax=Parahaliea maris TaxID=2716870 RepID=A0A5C8ZMU8_9GAMM|nr:IS110 family transposase [Parahaliea maris]TXS88887.1 IS110 family transposase [Parahaliea maris]